MSRDDSGDLLQAGKPVLIATSTMQNTNTPVNAADRVMMAAGEASDFQYIYKTPLAGGNGGQPFELSVPGKKVSKLEFWGAWDTNLYRDWSDWGRAIREVDTRSARLKGVRVQFEDKSVRQIGTLQGKTGKKDNEWGENQYGDAHTLLTLQPGDSITSVTMTSNPTFDGGRAANVELQTNFGEKYTATNWPLALSKHGNLVTNTDVEHKGYLLGVYGRADNEEIHSIGLIIALPEDEEYQLLDVVYDIPSKILYGAPENVKIQDLPNDSSAPVKTTYTYKTTYTRANNWTDAKGFKLGAKVTGGAGIPFVADGKIEISLEGSWTYTVGSTLTKSMEKTRAVEITVPPKSHMEVFAAIYMATMDIPYTAKLVKKRSDGNTVEIPAFSGVYHSVDCGYIKVNPRDLPPPPTLDRIAGKYENYTHDTDGQKTPWHLVTVTKQDKTLEWKNEAGIAWTLMTTSIGYELAVDPAYFDVVAADQHPDRKIVTVLCYHETVIGLKYGGETYTRVNTLQLPTLESIAGKYENYTHDTDGQKNPWHLVTVTKQDKTLEWKNEAGTAWTLMTTSNGYELAVDPAYFDVVAADQHPDRKIVTVLCYHGTVIGLKYGGETYTRVNTLQLPTLESIAGRYVRDNPENSTHDNAAVRKRDDATLELRRGDYVVWSLKTTANPYELAVDSAKNPEAKIANVLCHHGAITGLKFQGVTYRRKSSLGLPPLERIVGRYKRDNAENSTHHVTITKRDDTTLEWKNQAGEAWSLTTMFNAYELAVDSAKYPKVKIAWVAWDHETVIGLKFNGETYSRQA